MSYAYSAKTNSFYPFVLQSDYEASGDWPDEYIEVDDAVFSEFTAYVEGKIRVAGKDGMPEWADIPPLTPEQLATQAENTRAQLKSTADSEISWRQDAVDAEIATDEEAAKLTAWKKYRVLLMRVDTSKAPDIKWPKVPA